MRRSSHADPYDQLRAKLNHANQAARQKIVPGQVSLSSIMMRALVIVDSRDAVASIRRRSSQIFELLLQMAQDHVLDSECRRRNRGWPYEPRNKSQRKPTRTGKVITDTSPDTDLREMIAKDAAVLFLMLLEVG